MTKYLEKVNQRGEIFFFWLSSPQSLGSVASGLCAMGQNIMVEVECDGPKRLISRWSGGRDRQASTAKPPTVPSRPLSVAWG